MFFCFQRVGTFNTVENWTVILLYWNISKVGTNLYIFFKNNIPKCFKSDGMKFKLISVADRHFTPYTLILLIIKEREKLASRPQVTSFAKK